MSCVLFWCCGGRQSNADREEQVKEGEVKKDGGKFKRMKMWITRKMKRQQKRSTTKDVERAEESQARQQPAAGEKQRDAPHVPAGVWSGSLDTISSVILEQIRTPLHHDLEIKAEADLHEKDGDNNHLLGGDETTEATLTEDEAEAIEYLMLVINNIEAELLENERLEKAAAEAEAEAIQELMNILLDEAEESLENGLGQFSVTDTEPEAMYIHHAN
ncbi:hypothetical protein AOLI_G00038980 [Acnodon oligacanthus]